MHDPVCSKGVLFSFYVFANLTVMIAIHMGWKVRHFCQR